MGNDSAHTSSGGAHAPSSRHGGSALADCLRSLLCLPSESGSSGSRPLGRRVRRLAEHITNICDDFSYQWETTRPTPVLGEHTRPRPATAGAPSPIACVRSFASLASLAVRDPVRLAAVFGVSPNTSPIFVTISPINGKRLGPHQIRGSTRALVPPRRERPRRLPAFAPLPP